MQTVGTAWRGQTSKDWTSVGGALRSSSDHGCGTERVDPFTDQRSEAANLACRIPAQHCGDHAVAMVRRGEAACADLSRNDFHFVVRIDEAECLDLDVVKIGPEIRHWRERHARAQQVLRRSNALFGGMHSMLDAKRLSQTRVKPAGHIARRVNTVGGAAIFVADDAIVDVEPAA